jgi:hypothetical protein
MVKHVSREPTSRRYCVAGRIRERNRFWCTGGTRNRSFGDSHPVSSLNRSPVPELLERLGPPLTTRAERGLSLVNPMCQFDASQRYRCIAERLEAQHGGAAALDRAVIRLNDVVQVGTVPDENILPPRRA